jgi:flagellar operon protein
METVYQIHQCFKEQNGSFFMADMRLERLNSILNPPLGSQTPKVEKSDDSESFSSLLQKEIQSVSDVKFSKHAQQRLESRNITLSDEDVQKLSSAMDKAQEKGVQDSLVIMNNLAFIMSVPDKTVITAIPIDEAKQTTFTNIDGAVIL